MKVMLRYISRSRTNQVYLVNDNIWVNRTADKSLFVYYSKIMASYNMKYGGYDTNNVSTCKTLLKPVYALPQQTAVYQGYPVKSQIARYSLDLNNIAVSYSYNYSPIDNYSVNNCGNYYSIHSCSSAYYEQKSSVKTTYMIQMEIPKQMVGAILGKQGSTINKFTRTSGAKINLSRKDEFVPGTTHRILTIKGNRSEVDHAFMLVDKKIAC